MSEPRCQCLQAPLWLVAGEDEQQARCTETAAYVWTYTAPDWSGEGFALCTVHAALRRENLRGLDYELRSL